MANAAASSGEPFGHLDKLIVQFSAELVSSPASPITSPRTSVAGSPQVASRGPGQTGAATYTTESTSSPRSALRASQRGRRDQAAARKSVDWELEGAKDEAMPSPVPAADRKASLSSPKDLDNLMADIANLHLDNDDGTKATIADDDTGLLPRNAATPNEESPMLEPPSPRKSRKRVTSVGKRQTKGANTAAAEICPYCDDAIGGYFSVKALGRYWHADHLRCNICDKVLGTATFFHKELDLFCGDCWTDHFSPRCEFCHEAILESCIEALGKNWHPEHFFCSQCGKKIGNGEPFMEHQSKAYCEEDYFSLFSPLCIKCEKAITTEFVEALGRKWHPNCFTCRTCNKTLSNGTFFELHGHGYCESHYHEAKGSICAGCSKPIAGRCLNVMGKKYHTEHFVCAFCMCALEKAAFKEGAGEKPYCVPCHTRLFG